MAAKDKMICEINISSLTLTLSLMEEEKMEKFRNNLENISQQLVAVLIWFAKET